MMLRVCYAFTLSLTGASLASSASSGPFSVVVLIDIPVAYVYKFTFARTGCFRVCFTGLRLAVYASRTPFVDEVTRASSPSSHGVV